MDPQDQQYQQLFQIFREECREHVQKLNDGLLALERQPNDAPLDEILRSAHSLKGASRMMGIKTMETIAHYLETLLTQLMRGEKAVSPTIMETLYKGVDAVSTALRSQEEGEEPERIEAVLEQIRIVAEENISSATAPTSAPLGTRQETQPSRGFPYGPIVKDENSVLNTIRVQTEKLDTLMNLTGELLVSKIEAIDNLRHVEKTLDLLEDWQRRLTRDPKPAPLLNHIDGLDEQLVKVRHSLAENTSRLERLVDEIHDGVRDLRLLPLSTILEPFPRMVRDLSHHLGKDVEWIMEGTATRLDKKILEEVQDPLIHLVRNSLDHGIEAPEERAKKGKPSRGRILIAARQEREGVLISVTDDGRGLDRKAVEKTAIQIGVASAEEIGEWRDEEVWELIFRPGFSTASTLTELSGRGVGLDAVLAKVERLKGSVTVESKYGRGVTFTLSLPVTLSTVHALLFRVSGEIFCVPTDALEKTLLLSHDQITFVEGKSTVVIDGVPLAFVWLADILNLRQEGQKDGTIPALLLQTPKGKAVLGVEALLEEQEIVVKGLGRWLGQLPNLAGGTILGEGQIALILNPNDLMRSLSHQGRDRPLPVSSEKPSPPLPLTKNKALVVEDSLTTRTLEKNILEAAGFDVTTAVDGEDAMVKLHEKGFDVIITDVQMPRMDGFTLTERIKKDGRFRDIPVILVTALQTESDKRRGIEVGADAYITKGTFDQRHLLEIIQRLV